LQDGQIFLASCSLSNLIEEVIQKYGWLEMHGKLLNVVKVRIRLNCKEGGCCIWLGLDKRKNQSRQICNQIQTENHLVLSFKSPYKRHGFEYLHDA
jgi:hypothetical protein